MSLLSLLTRVVLLRINNRVIPLPPRRPHVLNPFPATTCSFPIWCVRKSEFYSVSLSFGSNHASFRHGKPLMHFSYRICSVGAACSVMKREM